MAVRGLKHLAMLLGCKIGQSLSSQQTVDRQKREEEKSKTRQKKAENKPIRMKLQMSKLKSKAGLIHFG